MLEAPCAIPAHPAVFLVEAPTAPVSSTEIRACVRAGRSITDLVPAGVAAYIERHGLYADAPKDFA
jgi:nicotinate-nucleotide adenylyltransferase